MSKHDTFQNKAYWKRRFIWKKPRRCELTGKLIWLMYAYEGVVLWTGPGEPIIEFRYHKTEEHLLWLMTK